MNVSEFLGFTPPMLHTNSELFKGNDEYGFPIYHAWDIGDVIFTKSETDGLLLVGNINTVLGFCDDCHLERDEIIGFTTGIEILKLRSENNP